MKNWIWVSLVLTLSCGRRSDVLGSYSSASGGGGGQRDTSGVTGGVQMAGEGGSAIAEDLGPFGEPSVIPVVTDLTYTAEDPSLTGDELELFFASSRSAPVGIWVALRASPDAAWEEPTHVVELGTDVNEPCVSRDGLIMMFSERRSGDSQIWITRRPNRNSAWDSPELVPELSLVGYDDEKPSLTADQLSLAFMSNRPGGRGGFDIWWSKRPSPDSAWGEPENVTEVNTRGDEVDPFLSDDRLHLYWTGEAPARRILAAGRSSLEVPFASFRTHTELGASAYDVALSADLKHILFASRRGTDKVQRLYEAFR